MMQPADPFERDLFHFTLAASPAHLKKEPEMDNHLAEMLSSAGTDHVLAGGTGNFDFLIQRLTESLDDPNNAPFADRIHASISLLELQKSTAPKKIEIRQGVRDVLGPLLSDFVMNEKGPMELEFEQD